MNLALWLPNSLECWGVDDLRMGLSLMEATTLSVRGCNTRELLKVVFLDYSSSAPKPGHVSTADVHQNECIPSDPGALNLNFGSAVAQKCALFLTLLMLQLTLVRAL